MGDYHTIGAQRDRAKTWSYLERIAKALERIADNLEAGGRAEPHIAAGFTDQEWSDHLDGKNASTFQVINSESGAVVAEGLSYEEAIAFMRSDPELVLSAP